MDKIEKDRQTARARRENAPRARRTMVEGRLQTLQN